VCVLKFGLGTTVYRVTEKGAAAAALSTATAPLLSSPCCGVGQNGSVGRDRAVDQDGTIGCRERVRRVVGGRAPPAIGVKYEV